MNYAVAMRLGVLGVLATSLMAGCGGVQSRVTKGSVQTTIDQSPDKGSYLEAIGIGASDPELKSDTQRKSLARDAAIVKAQYELMSMVKGVELEGGYTIERAIESDSSLESRVADSKRIGKTPVARGSRVPAWPTRCAPVRRRSRLTTANDVSPAALSTLSTPVGN